MPWQRGLNSMAVGTELYGRWHRRHHILGAESPLAHLGNGRLLDKSVSARRVV